MAFANIAALLSWDAADVGSSLRAMRDVLPLPDADVDDERRVDGHHSSLYLMRSACLTTPEDSPAPQPPASSNHDILAVADIRLDNRRSLLAAVGLAQAERTVTDDELLCAAYRRWGLEFSSRLRGDFAFILWDAGLQRLVAGQDIFGMRSIVYGVAAQRVVLGSTVALVVAGLGQEPRLDRTFLRAFLQRRSPEPSQTAFEGICRLKRGHLLVVGDGHVTVRRVDRLQPSADPPRTAADAYHRFRAALTDSVDVRLRSRGPVGCFVSGGFDSASIMCLADRLRCEASGVPIRAYSAALPESADEPYLAAVIEQCRHVSSERLNWEGRSWSARFLSPQAATGLDEPLYASPFFLGELTRHARVDGCRAVLTGRWGDQVVTRNPYRHLELLLDLPLRAVARQASRFFPTDSRRFVRRMGELATTTMRGWADSGSPRSTVARMLYQRFESGRFSHVMYFHDRLARVRGVEFRAPYLDRQVVELIMGFRAEHLLGDGRPKQLQRRSLEGVLPATFQDRTSFANITSLYRVQSTRELEQIRTILQQRAVIDAGLLSEKERASMLRPWKPGVTPVTTIERLLIVELWLRQCSSRTSVT